MPDKDNAFGKRLKALRIERDMSQEEMAKLLGTTKQVISNYETGKRSPKVSVAIAYAKILGVGIEELSGRQETTYISPQALIDQDRLEALHQNPRLGLLFDRSAKMSEADVEFMLQMADRILRERDT